MKVPLFIMIIDDEENMRNSLSKFLHQTINSKVVGESDNGRSAIALALKLKPDLIIMDITMPQLNGVEATRQIMRLLPKTKIIALTSHRERACVKKMFLAGAYGYVLKEACFNELVPAIEKVCNNNLYISPGVIDENVTTNEL